jgi:DNA-binding response OmpR family regulator
MPTSADRILVIDDDVELCALVAEYLAGEGFAADCVHAGDTGLQRALKAEHVLVVLDVMLPGLNGFEVLRQLRTASRTPVLLLTARGEDVDRILGLELGADDYLPKPFNPRELVARIRAILRRSQTSGSLKQPVLQAGGIELDTATRTVRQAGVLVELTSVEFNLLEVLLRSAGQVVTRDKLATAVLGRKFAPFDRSIDMHVSKVRKKLGGTDGSEDLIKTVRGSGYIFAATLENGHR